MKAILAKSICGVFDVSLKARDSSMRRELSLCIMPRVASRADLTQLKHALESQDLTGVSCDHNTTEPPKHKPPPPLITGPWTLWHNTPEESINLQGCVTEAKKRTGTADLWAELNVSMLALLYWSAGVPSGGVAEQVKANLGTLMIHTVFISVWIKTSSKHLLVVAEVAVV